MKSTGKMKKVLLILLSLALMLSLTGCGGLWDLLGDESDRIAAYIQGYLDLTYKGQFNEDYMEELDLTEEDMQEREYRLMYPDGLAGGLQAFLDKERKVFHDPWLKAFSSIRGYDGVVEAFRRLSSMMPVAVLTDFPIGVKLEALGLAPYVGVAVSSEDIGRLKPSACCFRVLSERVGVAPERILYVGDSERKDVLGALNYKMHAVLITNDRKKAASSRADIVVSGYGELMDALL